MTTDRPFNSSNNEFPSPGERLVYVLPEEAIQAFVEEELSLLDLWTIMWRAKWLIIVITTVISIASIIYTLSATEWYRADVLLAQPDQNSAQGLSGTLGGLASLAGVNTRGRDSVEALAILRSREFAAEFIQDKNLLKLFFSDRWDGSTGTWISEEGMAQPDIRDAIKYFNENVRTVNEDSSTGLVTLSIEWTDPGLAAEWANLLVDRLNQRMREKALNEAQKNVEYLQAEIGKTSIITLQQSIGRLMESELQKLMLARGNDEFAFQIIDHAQIPKVRSRPRRTLTVILVTFAGGVFAVLFVLVLDAVRKTSITKS